MSLLVLEKYHDYDYPPTSRLRASSAPLMSLLGSLGSECGASITWMAAGEASVDICSLLGLDMVCVVCENLAGWWNPSGKRGRSGGGY